MTSTQRLAAIAEQLLKRYGILTRGMAARESVPGGFAALYPILKAMEERVSIRRGYFVAGLGGAQFAAPGADDLLRRSRQSDQNEEPTILILILAATDPANPYGSVLSWPDVPDEQARPQRAAGARVILIDGHLRGYLTRTSQQLLTFFDPEDPDRTHARKTLAKALANLAHQSPPVFIAKIDNASPDAHELARELAAVGFMRTSRGYLHRGEKVAMPRSGIAHQT